MLLTEITDTEPLGLTLLNNLLAKGTPVLIDILEVPDPDHTHILEITHILPSGSVVTKWIQNLHVTYTSDSKPDHTIVWASMNGSHVLVPTNRFDDLLTLEKHNHQWVLTNASH
jgi:hypothetical protein